jgi:ApbE superfamily uncharacterized protein (UPF0280 family)
MANRAQIHLLPDGKRLFLHDGPIDVILEAFGTHEERHRAYAEAAERFVTILDELCRELPILRQPAGSSGVTLHGPMAQRMEAAVLPYASRWFITPMAAVAGAVAEELLAAMTSAASLERAYVNDGGDIALHLEHGQFRVGMIDQPDEPSLFGSIMLHPGQPVRGIATSGWRGRSFSLGIADAVTVLADRASMADAAATIIANAVDLPGHAAITRQPAHEITPDNDLGNLLVTRAVGKLTLHEVESALTAGEIVAQTLLEQELIRAAALRLQGHTRTIGVPLRSPSLENSGEPRRLLHA